MLKSKIYASFAGIFALLAVLGWHGLKVKSQTLPNTGVLAEKAQEAAVSAQTSRWLGEARVKEAEIILAEHFRNSAYLHSSEARSLISPAVELRSHISLFDPETLPNIEQKPAAVDAQVFSELLKERFFKDLETTQSSMLAYVSLADATVYSSSQDELANHAVLRLRQGSRDYFGSELSLQNNNPQRLTWTCTDQSKTACIIRIDQPQDLSTHDYQVYYVIDDQVFGSQSEILNNLWQEMKSTAGDYFVQNVAETGDLTLAYAANGVDSGILLAYPSRSGELAHANTITKSQKQEPFNWKSILLAVLAAFFVIAVGLLVIRRDILDSSANSINDDEKLNKSLDKTDDSKLQQEQEKAIRALEQQNEELEIRIKEHTTRSVQLDEQFAHIREAYQNEKKLRIELEEELKTLRIDIEKGVQSTGESTQDHVRIGSVPPPTPSIPAPKRIGLPTSTDMRKPKAQTDTEEVTNREMDAILDSSSQSDINVLQRNIDTTSPSTRITANIEADDISHGLGESEWEDIVSSFDSIMDMSFPGAGLMQFQSDDSEQNPDSTLNSFGRKLRSQERKLSFAPPAVQDSTPVPAAGVRQGSGLSPLPSSPPSFAPVTPPKDTLHFVSALRKSSPSLPQSPFVKQPSALGNRFADASDSGIKLNTIPGTQKAISRIESGDTATGLAAVQKEAPSVHPLLDTVDRAKSDTRKSSAQTKAVPTSELNSSSNMRITSTTPTARPSSVQHAVTKRESGNFKPAPSWTGRSIQDAPSMDSNTLLDALKRRTRDVSQIALDPVTANTSSEDIPSLSKSGVFSVTGSRVDVDPLNDTEYYKNLYDKFIETKKACGEPTDKLTLDRFISRLARNKESLMQTYQCKNVRFQVYVKDGKTALKATPIK
ncbi:MAG: MXAN_5187 C-terminal domain-containing protein [Bradymonadales bacterium]